MKTAPIRPARIAFGDRPDTAPRSLDFNADYPTAEAGLARARQTYLHGTALPERWAGRAHFVVLETDFGLGHNFLATWQAWRDDPDRCARLCVVALASHPPSAADLARAHAVSPRADGTPRDTSAVATDAAACVISAASVAALVTAWPPLTPNLHSLDFDGGAVQLLLALGDVTLLLPALQLQVDAIFLDGFAPACNPAVWQLRVLKALGRKAAVGAQLASWCATAELHHLLRSAGFAVQPTTSATAATAGPGATAAIASDSPAAINRMTRATWAPYDGSRGRARPGLAYPSAEPPQTAVVVGAGVAGAAAALALARMGVSVTVLDRHSTPAEEASGNLAGLFHGTVNGDDGIYARLFRAAALQAARSYGQAIAHDPQIGALQGLLRLSLVDGGARPTQAAIDRLVDRLGLPTDWVQALGAAAASQRAAVPLPAPAWFYPDGGWLAPARWVRHVLAQHNVRFQGDADAAHIRFEDGWWTVSDVAQRRLSTARVLVLASAASTPRLLQAWSAERWPLAATRGQVTHVANITNITNITHAGPGRQASSPLRCAVAGDGYAIPLQDGSLLCGATRETATLAQMLAAPDISHQTTAAAHWHNLERLQRLTGLPAPADLAAVQGRSGWRLHTDDRLPIAGAMPLREWPAGQRRDQARLLPRVQGLFVLTALGARGLTLAPLLGRLVAAQATGTPWPLEQDLADAVDPARWRVRAARRDQTRA